MAVIRKAATRRRILVALELIKELSGLLEEVVASFEEAKPEVAPEQPEPKE